MNNGKYHTDSYLQKQEEKTTRRFGPVENHIKTCEVCQREFTWSGRQRTKEFERIRFCSRGCANTRGGEASAPKLKNHITIARKHFNMVCLVCGFASVVDVHHLDEDHSNNSVDNLVPLCPNHHRMIHRNEFKDELFGIVTERLPFRYK